jgi:hypothetical protein
MSGIFATLMLLVLATMCIGQPITQTVVLEPDYQVNVERYKTVISTNPYQESGDTFRETSPNLTGRAYVGKQDDEPDLKNTFRMVNSFNLGGIPEHSEIVSVKLIVTLTVTSHDQDPEYEFDVYNCPANVIQLSAEAKWSAIDQASKVLDLGSLPVTTHARNYEVGTYYSASPFANHIKSRFGTWCHLALKSSDENWGGSWPAVHVLDFKNNNSPAIGPKASFKLEISYRPYHPVAFINEGGFTGPTWDFRIDGVQRAHGYSTLWQPTTEHDIEMNSHSQIPFPTDNGRPYDRVPKEWSRTGDIRNLGAYWNDVTVQAATVFTARHHRIVENQFATLYEANGTELDIIPFNIGGQASSSGDIESTYHGEDYSYVVTLPFSHLDQASGRTYFMVNWKPDAYGAWDGSANTVTQAVSPDLHHKVVYGNPYVAEYQNFIFRSIDNNDELPSVVPSGFYVNNSTKEMSFTIPLSVDVSGVEYVFYGWDDNSASTIDYANGTVTKSFVLGDDDFNYAMAMSGKYKAHLYSGATFSGTESVCGTCPNSQRKLDWIVAQTGLASGADGIYQAVYESSSRVWYTESTDHAQTWRPEILVGAGHRPTIANSSNAAYISYNGDGDIVTLKYADRNFSDISCQQSAPYASLDAAPAMVIDSTESVVFVVWETTSGELRYAAYVDDDIADVGMIPGTGQYGTPVRPSLGHRQGTQAYHLAWRENEHIIYSEIKIDAYGSQWGGILFKPTVLLSNAGHYARGRPVRHGQQQELSGGGMGFVEFHPRPLHLIQAELFRRMGHDGNHDRGTPRGILGSFGRGTVGSSDGQRYPHCAQRGRSARRATPCQRVVAGADQLPGA